MEVKVEKLRIGYRLPYRELVLAEDVAFDLPTGSLTGLIGINGSGKSTLLRTLAGLQPPLAGELLMGSARLPGISARHKAQLLSVVLTEPPASRNLTVRELVSLGRYPYTNWVGALSDADQGFVEGALKQMELEAIAGQACHTLSDGQLQRAQIARALAQDTPLLLLDEPTTHLDLYHKVRILKSLRQIAHQHGKTVLFTTHEIDLAIQLCDRMLVLHDGAVTAGQPCELIQSGAFASLFPEDTVRFEPDSGRYRVNK